MTKGAFASDSKGGRDARERGTEEEGGRERAGKRERKTERQIGGEGTDGGRSPYSQYKCSLGNTPCWNSLIVLTVHWLVYTSVCSCSTFHSYTKLLCCDSPHITLQVLITDSQGHLQRLVEGTSHGVWCVHGFESWKDMPGGPTGFFPWGMFCLCIDDCARLDIPCVREDDGVKMCCGCGAVHVGEGE
jgi:hypothetical protein